MYIWVLWATNGQGVICKVGKEENYLFSCRKEKLFHKIFLMQFFCARILHLSVPLCRDMKYFLLYYLLLVMGLLVIFSYIYSLVDGMHYICIYCDDESRNVTAVSHRLVSCLSLVRVPSGCLVLSLVVSLAAILVWFWCDRSCSAIDKT